MAWDRGYPNAHEPQRAIRILPQRPAATVLARPGWDRSPSCLKSSDEGSAARPAHQQPNGANMMRSFLALTLLMTLFASANAATVHHAKPRHVIVRPSQGLILRHAIPGYAYAPPPPALHYDDTPSYNDPSKFGGDTAY
jgi:hypothetical protein